MTQNGMVSALSVLLADTYTLYLKTQNYHWNVESTEFYMLHKMFEEQYEALSDANDEIAERIRALGAKAPGSLEEFLKLKTISEAKKDISAKEMIAELKVAHEAICAKLKLYIDQSGDEKDLATQDMLITRLSEHQKIIWMLGAHL